MTILLDLVQPALALRAQDETIWNGTRRGIPADTAAGDTAKLDMEDS